MMHHHHLFHLRHCLGYIQYSSKMHCHAPDRQEFVGIYVACYRKTHACVSSALLYVVTYMETYTYGSSVSTSIVTIRSHIYGDVYIVSSVSTISLLYVVTHMPLSVLGFDSAMAESSGIDLRFIPPRAESKMCGIASLNIKTDKKCTHALKGIESAHALKGEIKLSETWRHQFRGQPAHSGMPHTCPTQINLCVVP